MYGRQLMTVGNGSAALASALAGGVPCETSARLRRPGRGGEAAAVVAMGGTAARAAPRSLALSSGEATIRITMQLQRAYPDELVPT